MKRTTPSFLGCALAIAMLHASCGKDAVDIDANYVGLWAKEGSHNADTCDPTIRIESDGKAEYYSNTSVQGCSKIHHSGKARIQDDHLRIGSKSMLIGQAPTAFTQREIWYSAGPGQEPGTTSMSMTLDGITMYRIDGE